MVHYRREDLTDVETLVNLRIQFLYEAEKIDKETPSDLLEEPQLVKDKSNTVYNDIKILYFI